MGYEVKYQLDTICEFRNSITDNGNNLIQSFNDILNSINNLEDIFDTPTGKIFKENLVQFINNKKMYINDNYLNFGNSLDKIITIYELNDASIYKNVNGDINGEI